MAEEDDNSQKTEEPTQRRLEEAFKRGQVIHSKEITHFLMLLCMTLIVAWVLPSISKISSLGLSNYVDNSFQVSLDKGNLGRVMLKMFKQIMVLLGVPLVLTVVTAIASSILQNRGRVVLAAESVMPDISRISPMKGLSKLFSLRSLVELIKIILKLIVLVSVSYLILADDLAKLELLYEYSISGILAFTLDMSVDMLIGICIAMAFLAGIDYFYQRFEFLKTMRMSKQELKEEYKQTEGSPEIKAKLKRMRSERARKRMMAAVPKADVVITNPTHFSIALEYDIGKMKAPRVVAKGQDNIALKIREIAEKNSVPIIENPPLARSLYSSVGLEEEIPEEHYQAVAEIISYVYKLKGKK